MLVLMVVLEQLVLRQPKAVALPLQQISVRALRLHDFTAGVKWGTDCSGSLCPKQ